MATRTMEVHVERGASPHCLYVTCDKVQLERIRNLEGVNQVAHHQGRVFEVIVDRRYNPAEVERDIIAACGKA